MSGDYQQAKAYFQRSLARDEQQRNAEFLLADPDEGEETEDYTAGVHYFLKGHNARAGVEYRWGDSDDWTLLGLQILL